MLSWLFRKDDTPEPPYSYQYINYLREEEYPAHLKKLYEYHLKTKLNLKKPKNFNEKIQWMKLFENSSLKHKLTNKLEAREYVKEKIGEEFLPNLLQVCDKYEEIDFEKLPSKFFLQLSNSQLWKCSIKNKEELLKNEKLASFWQQRVSAWTNLSSFPDSKFNKNYLNLDRKIVIEEYLDRKNTITTLCINGNVEIIQTIKKENKEFIVTSFDKDFNEIENFSFSDTVIIEKGEFPNNYKNVVELSEKIAKEFNLVQINWLISNDKLYFDRLDFAPYSGFCKFNDEIWNKKLGDMIILKK